MNSSSSDDDMNENNTIVSTNTGYALKILKDIRLICKDEVLAAATYRVYLDLCEIRKYEEVSYKINEQINQIYLEVRKTKEDPVEIVIPILSMKQYSFRDFEKYQDAFDRDTINIAIYDSSTTALYKLTRSLK